MSPQQALTVAREKGLDLVEISPTAQPPVCRIMDYGRYQYEEQKRTRQAKKHQKTIEVKEIKFRPRSTSTTTSSRRSTSSVFSRTATRSRRPSSSGDARWPIPSLAVISSTG